jgi:hypothetical protein
MSPLNAAICTTISYTLWVEWYYSKNNYLTLRSRVKVPRRSLRYATHRFMVAKLVRNITFLSFEIGQWYLVCGYMTIRRCVTYRNDLRGTLTFSFKYLKQFFLVFTPFGPFLGNGMWCFFLILSSTMLFNMFKIVVLNEFFHSFALFEWKAINSLPCGVGFTHCWRLYGNMFLCLIAVFIRWIWVVVSSTFTVLDKIKKKHHMTYGLMTGLTILYWEASILQHLLQTWNY